ncbi:MAG TPA: metal ABC transporter permease [Thermoplasmata archaeon]|nr:metal ABC transporter permease [Thermoplasmata archaeon]
MSDSVVYSLVAGLVVGLAAGYVGSLMILKRMALVGDVLSHVALPGIALGLLFHFYPFFGAFVFLFAAVVATWFLERSTRLPLDAVIGVLFVFALAVGILITPTADLLDALFGDIASVGLFDALLAIGISLCILVVGRWIYHAVILSLISEDLAIAKKVKVGRVDFLYLLLVALVVAAGITVVGMLLVGAVVILPAVSAKNVSRSLAHYALLSAVLGMVTAAAGIALAALTNIQPGPLVVVTGTAVFVGTVAIKAKGVSLPLRPSARDDSKDGEPRRPTA